MRRILFSSIISVTILMAVATPATPNLLSTTDVEYITPYAIGNSNSGNAGVIIEEEDEMLQAGLPKTPDASSEEKIRLPDYTMPASWCSILIHLPPPKYLV